MIIKINYVGIMLSQKRVVDFVLLLIDDTCPVKFLGLGILFRGHFLVMCVLIGKNGHDLGVESQFIPK